MKSDAQGNALLRRVDVLLLILGGEQTPVAQVIVEARHQVCEAMRAGKFSEGGLYVEHGEEQSPEVLCARVFEAWLIGRLTLTNPNDASGLPERPPESKSALARLQTVPESPRVT